MQQVGQTVIEFKIELFNNFSDLFFVSRNRVLVWPPPHISPQTMTLPPQQSANSCRNKASSFHAHVMTLIFHVNALNCVCMSNCYLLREHTILLRVYAPRSFYKSVGRSLTNGSFKEHCTKHDLTILVLLYVSGPAWRCATFITCLVRNTNNFKPMIVLLSPHFTDMYVLVELCLSRQAF